ncbi:macrolide transporter subunit MacA [Botrimarina colliarenosi]|uniref:Macrolide transporter subunit MacA n=1 Tax=Botrimarina colliarenosi TaxID=2528001 RepID=A0A5C6AJ63_9BACT|nr:efflux RND transporter periplasmic adaptor subunit [Botrimarina colliarenosi]TWT99507.1 macrolide transporter subunit MacA [Botrimarina colliarenosi]
MFRRPPHALIRQRHSGGALLWLALLVCLASGGGYAWWRSVQASGAASGTDDAVLHTVERQDFSLQITERGEIQSAGGVEVKSAVKTQGATGNAILRIIPEGTQVEPGDFLVELDSSTLVSDRLLQQINVNTAEAAVIEAQNLYETAIIAQQEYVDGLFVQEKQTIESEIFVAEEDLSRAKEYVQYSKRLAAKGYVSELQLQADRFAVENAQKALDAAKTKLRVLEDFTKAKTVKQLESDAAITSAKWESLKNSYQLETDKLREIEDQIAKCVITAPAAGTVTYAHGEDQRGGGEEFVVEEGAVIRERQTIIRLPDISSMQVEVEVNESLIQYIRQGMPAAVKLVGGDGKVLRGRVARVNQYAEPTNWRRANVKDYKAFVAIEEPTAQLKTGMTASVTISAMFVPDSLVTPVQSIYAHGDKLYCFVKEGDQLAPHEVTVGPTNDRFFVVETGLEANDRVALNPRALVDQVALPEISSEQKQHAVDTGSDWRRLQEAPKPAAPASDASGDTTAAKQTAGGVAGQG